MTAAALLLRMMATEVASPRYSKRVVTVCEM